MATRLRQSGRTGSDTREIITLTAYAAANNYSTLRIPGAGAGYQVTAGKTFYITRVLGSSNGTTSAQTDIHFGTSTADAGLNVVGAPAGMAFMFGDGATLSLTPFVMESATSPAIDVYLAEVAVAASKYITVRIMSRAGGIIIEGYEE